MIIGRVCAVCGLCHRFPVERHWHQSIDGFTLHISILRKLTEVDCEWTIPTAHVRTVFSLFLKRSTDRDCQKLQMMEYDDLQIPYSMYRSNVTAIISFPDEKYFRSSRYCYPPVIVVGFESDSYQSIEWVARSLYNTTSLASMFPAINAKDWGVVILSSDSRCSLPCCLLLSLGTCTNRI